MRQRLGRSIVAAIPYLWLAVFFLVPFLIVAKISFSTADIAMPPYQPAFDLADGVAGIVAKAGQFVADNYRRIVSDGLFIESYLSSLETAAISTLVMLVVAYPLAYAMARAPARFRPTLMMLVILPFWTSFLIRVYAWKVILTEDGLLNGVLLATGLIDQPLVILQTNWAVYIGIVYCYLPFMVLPLYSALEKLDDSLIEAALDLGARPFTAFWRITFPLSLPGVIAGSFLVFIPAVGEFVIPDLLGGSDTLMIGKTLSDEFFTNRDWPSAAAVAVVLVALLVVPIVIYQNVQAKMQEGGR
jgi:putrescine transport system permease protein